MRLSLNNPRAIAAPGSDWFAEPAPAEAVLEQGAEDHDPGYAEVTITDGTMIGDPRDIEQQLGIPRGSLQ